MALEDLDALLSRSGRRLLTEDEKRAPTEEDPLAGFYTQSDPSVARRLADIPMNLASLAYHGVTEPITTIEAIGSAAKKSLIDETIKDPLSWIPFAAETAGTIAGGLGLGPLGPAAGALAGRVSGEVIDAIRTGKPLFTNERLTNMLAAPLFQLPLGVGVSYLKGKLKPVAEGSEEAVKALPKTIFEPLAQRVPKRADIDQIISEAWQKANFLRNAEYEQKPTDLLRKPLRTMRALESSSSGVPDEQLQAVRELVQSNKARGKERIQDVRIDQAGARQLRKTLEEDILMRPTPGIRRIYSLPQKEGAGQWFTGDREIASELAKQQKSVVQTIDVPERFLSVLENKSEGAGYFVPDDFPFPRTPLHFTSPLAATPDELSAIGRLKKQASPTRAQARIRQIEEETRPDIEAMLGIQSPFDRERLRGTTPQGQIATATRANYLEEVKRMKAARKRVPGDISEDILDIQRMVAVAPEASDSPWVREGKKVGLAPELFSMDREMRKFGDENMIRTHDLMKFRQELQARIIDEFEPRALDTIKKHGITEDDWYALATLDRNPELMQAYRAGKIVPATKIDKQRLSRVMAFAKEYQDEVGDPSFAIALQVDPDPSKIGPFRTSYLWSSSVAAREAQETGEDVARLTRELSSLSPDEQAGALGQELSAQIAAMNRRKMIADASLDDVANAMNKAEELMRLGVVPTKANFKAYLPKKTDLLFGSRPEQNARDYIHGLARKVSLDLTLPGMRKYVAGDPERSAELLGQLIKTLPSETKSSVLQIARETGQNSDKLFTQLAIRGELPHIDREAYAPLAGELRIARGVMDRRAKEYATKAIMAQTGQYKMGTINRIADTIKDIPGLSKYGDPQSVMKTLDFVNQYLYYVDIGLSPRFVPMQMMQNVMTQLPLVGGDAFAHGFMQTIGNWKAVTKRAREAGILTHNDMRFFGEAAGAGTSNKFLRMAGWAAEQSEKFNRTWAFASGEYLARKAGLKGKEALQKAAAISKQANFGYGLAEKPLIANAPLGGLAYRFRSFTANYATFLKHLMETEPKKAAEAITLVLGTAGTAGIPMYSWIREAAANQGVYLPEVEPLSQVTGLDFGRSTDPFFRAPQNTSELVDFAAGPFFGPLAKGTAAFFGGDDQGQAFALQRLAGPLLSRTVQGVGELARGGETRTPTNKDLLTRRDTPTILKSMVSMAPSARQMRGRLLEDLQIAERARDPLARREIFRRGRELGAYNLRKLRSQAKAKVKREDQQSVVSILLGE